MFKSWFQRILNDLEMLCLYWDMNLVELQYALSDLVSLRGILWTLPAKVDTAVLILVYISPSFITAIICSYCICYWYWLQTFVITAKQALALISLCNNKLHFIINCRYVLSFYEINVRLWDITFINLTFPLHFI